MLRIEDFIRRHLEDPDLDPTAIAAAHNISLRHLYGVFANRHETPSEWIMLLRLEAARAELSSGTSNISATGQRWGFKTPSHFSRRFKAAYGMTPREWQLGLCRAPGLSPGPLGQLPPSHGLANPLSEEMLSPDNMR